jgi:hypothetical protein
MFKERKNQYFLSCCQDILVAFVFAMDFKVDTTVLSIYEILFLHLFQYSVGRGIGGNLQVFTDVMPV